MEENEKNKTTSVIAIEVNRQDFNSKGELIDAIAASAKITKADAGREVFTDEDSLSLKLSGCGAPKIEVDYNAASTDTLADDASKNTTLELDVKGQTFDMTKGELIDAIAAGSKLTKADAGRLSGQTSEDWFNLQVEGANESDCGKTEVRSHSKLTKADAGRNLDAAIESTK